MGKGGKEWMKFTCVCGGQQFTIQDCTITCPACGRIHSLMWLDGEGKEKGEFILLESAEDFNKRIRIDHCLEYVRKEGEK